MGLPPAAARRPRPAPCLDPEAAMVIDVHAHFWTDGYLDKVAALGKTDTAT